MSNFLCHAVNRPCRVFSAGHLRFPRSEESEGLVPTTATFSRAFLSGELGNGLYACGCWEGRWWARIIACPLLSLFMTVLGAGFGQDREFYMV